MLASVVQLGVADNKSKAFSFFGGFQDCTIRYEKLF